MIPVVFNLSFEYSLRDFVSLEPRASLSFSVRDMRTSSKTIISQILSWHPDKQIDLFRVSRDTLTSVFCIPCCCHHPPFILIIFITTKHLTHHQPNNFKVRFFNSSIIVKTFLWYPSCLLVRDQRGEKYLRHSYQPDWASLDTVMLYNWISVDSDWNRKWIVLLLLKPWWAKGWRETWRNMHQELMLVFKDCLCAWKLL